MKIPAPPRLLSTPTAVETHRMRHVIVLVNPPYDSKQEAGSGRHLSVGIVLIATILARAGYQVKLIDGAIDPLYRQRFQDILVEDAPLFVGFSVMTSQVAIAYEMTKQVKKWNPRLKVVWGGFHPTIFPEQTITAQELDFVVAGEGVNVIVPLADALASNGSLGHIPGIYYLEKGAIRFTGKQPQAEFSQIPDLDWSVYERQSLERVIVQTNALGRQVRQLPILTGLGCNFKCAFCFNAIYGLRHRAMDALQIVANMKRLQYEYGVDEVAFYDEHFFARKDRVLTFVNQLEGQNLNIFFYANMRASDVRRGFLGGDFLKRWRRVGGYNLGVGAESGSDQVLRKLNKGITVQDTRIFARVAQENEIIATFSFIVGIPGERIDEVYDTLDLVREIHAIDSKHVIIGPQIFRPYPGSPLFNQAVQEGLSFPETLEAWTKTGVVSHFRRLDDGDVPWISSPNLFERIIRVYNLTSYNAYIQGLQSILYWTIRKKIARFSFSPRVHFLIKGASDGLVKAIVRLGRWRLRKRNMAFMIEMPLVRFLEKTYFTEV